MSTAPTQRRLAAILATDVVGYSKLMGQDEAGTLAALKVLRTELLVPKVGEHGGRIFKSTGDGLLIEFPSVVNAVACAVDIQSAMAERNLDQPETRVIRLRIGVNLGDIIVEDGDVFGDGVNVAARIESIAPPDGIAITETVRHHLGNRLALQFEDLGERSLKNIDGTVRVCLIEPAKNTGPKQGKSKALDTLPSIAVLPFQNMSSDPEQEYFADGLSEDLITALSKVPGLLVIARHSTFACKGKSTDIRSVARELGVSYVVEGSVRRVASRVRITFQLINAVDGTHLSADRFDRELVDIFALQDEVVEKIVAALAGALPKAYVRPHRRAPIIEAYDLFVKGRVLALQSPHTAKLARSYFEQAIKLDPDFAEAHAWLAMTMILHTIEWHREEPWENIRAEAERALTLDPDNADAHFVIGYVLAYERRLSEGREHFERALALNPNHADAWAFLGDVEVLNGRPQEAVRAAEKAFELNPIRLATHGWVMGFAQYAAQRYEDAIDTLSHPSCRQAGCQRILAAALAQLGRLEEAHEVARQYMQLAPKFTVGGWAKTQPFRDPRDRQHFVEGFLKAGLPA
jgi:TolB-like protein/class 3 adenylate cyclase